MRICVFCGLLAPVFFLAAAFGTGMMSSGVIGSEPVTVFTLQLDSVLGIRTL